MLNGYLERLQRPETLIHFFHDVVGIACLEPAVLEQRTNAYKAWVRRVTDELVGYSCPARTASAAQRRAQGALRPLLPFYRPTAA